MCGTLESVETLISVFNHLNFPKGKNLFNHVLNLKIKKIPNGILLHPSLSKDTVNQTKTKQKM